MTERPDFRTMDEEHRELVIKPRVDAFSSFLRSEWTRAPSADKVSEFLYANYHELLSTTRYFIEWGGFVAFMAYFVAMAGEDPSTLDEWQDRRRRVAQIDGMAALDKIRIATMIRNENPSAKMPQSVRDALSPLRDTTSVTLRLLNARVPRKRHREWPHSIIILESMLTDEDRRGRGRGCGGPRSAPMSGSTSSKSTPQRVRI